MYNVLELNVLFHRISFHLEYCGKASTRQNFTMGQLEKKKKNRIKPVKSDDPTDSEGDDGVDDGVPSGKECQRRMTEGRNECR